MRFCCPFFPSFLLSCAYLRLSSLSFSLPSFLPSFPAVPSVIRVAMAAARLLLLMLTRLRLRVLSLCAPPAGFWVCPALPRLDLSCPDF
ncbi:uncharacterized protein K452DRAFT_103256 [Aplosporella prunicola CBS 121167]|uniref:Uncharacterized protein n=1 Tax=Aplosporella prunicola CBS 121167 TaxID=1176127 RepID=A0A6A6BR55_9PEZI|nr:uncharacterized protein K452DRAFT_103256 [Aplosporella prunicola CBS 121167]KAF2145923.1 hypothetical protein K452DRAFT_103256 [Aplosporella prunicola CBS 121167]